MSLEREARRGGDEGHDFMAGVWFGVLIGVAVAWYFLHTN